jgi:hypothetical protein
MKEDKKMKKKKDKERIAKNKIYKLKIIIVNR